MFGLLTTQSKNKLTRPDCSQLCGCPVETCSGKSGGYMGLDVSMWSALALYHHPLVLSCSRHTAVQDQSVLDVFLASLLPFSAPGHPPKVFAPLVHSHLPADIAEQAGGSPSGEGPGACWNNLSP